MCHMNPEWDNHRESDVLQNCPNKGNVRTLNLCFLLIDKTIIGKGLWGMSGDVYHTLKAKETVWV